MKAAAREAARPYRPYGAALKMWSSHEPVVLMSGPAGTGKTVAALTKLYYCAIKYPGMRGAIVRQTRKSLTESALVTWEEKVVPAGDPCLSGPQRTHRSVYHFPNRSAIAVLGYDDPHKMYSSEYDLVFIQEALETRELEVEQLARAMRWNRMPYQQIIMDTNPGSPKHWLKQWAEQGRLQFLESRHQDNPFLWDRKKDCWTKIGESYMARLDGLTGVRKKRLREGLWVQAEGVVYDGWDDRIHLIAPFAIPKEWPRYLAVDFGFTNPFVCQWWAEDHDGRLYLYREIYMTQRLVEDHAKQIARYIAEDGKPPRAIICDHDAEDRATLERHLKRGTVPAKKDVSPGIQAVATRLREKRDGKPRLMIFRDALVERDPELVERKLPTCTVEEIDGYVWDERADRKLEVPHKENDHGCDAARYMVYYRDDRMAIGDVPKVNKPVQSTADTMPKEIFVGRGGVADVLDKKW